MYRDAKEELKRLEEALLQEDDQPVNRVLKKRWGACPSFSPSSGFPKSSGCFILWIAGSYFML